MVITNGTNTSICPVKRIAIAFTGGEQVYSTGEYREHKKNSPYRFHRFFLLFPGKKHDGKAYGLASCSFPAKEWRHSAPLSVAI